MDIRICKDTLGNALGNERKSVSGRSQVYNFSNVKFERVDMHCMRDVRRSKAE